MTRAQGKVMALPLLTTIPGNCSLQLCVRWRSIVLRIPGLSSSNAAWLLITPGMLQLYATRKSTATHWHFTRAESDMPQIAYLDCHSGISGDMFLGALLDAGLSLDTLKQALTSLPVTGYQL